jgi:hypothetical protein
MMIPQTGITGRHGRMNGRRCNATLLIFLQRKNNKGDPDHTAKESNITTRTGEKVET